MILVLKTGTTEERISEISSLIAKKFDVSAQPIFGSEATIIGLVGDTSLIPLEELEVIPEVDKLLKVQEPFKRANRKFHPDNTIVEVGEVKVGTDKIVICAGPCAVESESQIMSIAESVSGS